MKQLANGSSYSLKNRLAMFLFALFLFLIFWQSVVSFFRLPEYLVPAPTVVFAELCEHWPSYVSHALQTGAESASGFLLGSLTAFCVGLLFFRFSALRGAALPFITALQAIPVVAIAPLLIVWLGSGFLSKAVMAAIISFFPTLAAMLTSFTQVDTDALNLFRLYRAPYLTTVVHLLIPASLPSLVTGLKVSAGLASVGAIVAEMTGSDYGIGYLILNASYRLETPKLFVGILLAGILGVTAYLVPGLLRFAYPQAWAEARMKT